MLTIKNRNSLIFFVLFSLVFPVSLIFGAEVFNSSATDNPLRVGNYTQDGGTQNWQTSLSGVNPGDKLRFSIYYRNDGTQVANSTVRLDLSPLGDSSSFVTTSKISAPGFADYIKTVNIGITNSESINFTNTATWYHNFDGSVYQTTSVPVIVSGNTATCNLGVINPGYAPNDGYLVFDSYVSPLAKAGNNQTVNAGANVTLDGSTSVGASSYSWSCSGGISLSNSSVINPSFTAPSIGSVTTYNCTLTVDNPLGITGVDTVNITVNPTAVVTNNPVVSAGSNKTVTSGQSVTLQGTATHPDSLSMSYSWVCSGGSLSSSTVLQPVFYAPSVSSATTYNCTLTAIDSVGKSASSITYVTVNPVSSTTLNPVVNAGPNKTIQSGQLVNLEGTATHPNSLSMSYNWSCNGGSLSSSSVLQPVFYAPNVYSTTTYYCTLTATDTAGKSASSIMYVTANPTSSSYSSYYPIISAGYNKSIQSGQSVTLDGTSSHYGGLSISYNWSCNGGSLSSSSALQPTFYAPNVYSTETFSCTLLGTDTNGRTATSITYVTVNPSSNNYSSFSVSAGSNKTVTSGQSVTLDGSVGYNSYNYSYRWSCNGGSLSSSSVLQPTFYAPNVYSTTTYNCTLNVTDYNGRTSSAYTSITVNPSSYSSDFKISTNVAENVTTSSATLKALISSSTNNNISVRFNWGKTSQYNNNTNWTYNKSNGDIVSYFISGLEKGKAYSYRAEASNGSRTIYGESVSFITKSSPVTGFVALAAGSNQINLTWNKAVDSCYTMIVRKTGSYPSHGADGTVIYYGTSNSYLDQNISNNVWYYYKVWAVGCDQGLTSFSDSNQSRAYTVSNTPVYVTPITPIASSANVEFFARNITQNQIYWENNITAEPGDVIDFQIVITPTGERSLSNVKLNSLFSNGIVSVDDYQSSLNKEINVGKISLGDSETISFRGKIIDSEKINNQLSSIVQVSATGISTIEKSSVIDISQGLMSNLGSMIDIFNIGSLGWLLFILIIMMLSLIMYLVIDRNRRKEICEEEIKVEKSKYFNIK